MAERRNRRTSCSTRPKTCARGYHLQEFRTRVRILFRQREQSPRDGFGQYHDTIELKLAALHLARSLAERCDFEPAQSFAYLSGAAIRERLPEVMQTLRGVRFSRSVFQKVEEWVESVALSRDVADDFKARLDVANAAILKPVGKVHSEPQAPRKQPQPPAFADLEHAFSELRAELDRTRRVIDCTPELEPEDGRREAGMYEIDQGEPPDPTDWWKPGFQK